MMHVIKFFTCFSFLKIWDMLSHACALSGPNSFSNHIQNAQYYYKTNLELQLSLIRNSFVN